MLPWLPPHGYVRRPTREVAVGEVRLGGSQPIRIQSMTTPPVADVAATVDQITALVTAGCEIVRLTVPTPADADQIPEIRAALRRRGLQVPLVADIHFSPAAALRVIEHVEKVRINPGNFADSKRFARREYTDAQYGAELARLEEKLRPLVLRAKTLGVAMRIGTNHGSLSDRILNRFGDTPFGMVESALEFVRICEAHGYRELVLSMKASNPQVTLQAYRLLAARLAEEGMDYPFHLGVTEAGDGSAGRIKSAIGIGALLEEGIGDTVRVSLTEDPVAEIPVARALTSAFNARPGKSANESDPQAVFSGASRHGTHGLHAASPGASEAATTIYARRSSRRANWGPIRAGDGEWVRTEIRLQARHAQESLAGLLDGERRAEVVSIAGRSRAELELARAAARRIRSAGAAAALALDLRCARAPVPEEFPDAGLQAFDRLDLRVAPQAAGACSLVSTWARRCRLLQLPLLLECQVPEGSFQETTAWLEALVPLQRGLPQETSCDPLPTLALHTASLAGCASAVRALAKSLEVSGHACPLLLVDEAPAASACERLRPAARLGGLLCDGIGDSIRLDGLQSARWRLDLAYDILQGARIRLSKTEFISCPSCGRTLFDLESTTQRIKERTAHLKGVKIAIMGCVVNGPGEMADADFGYVGGAPGKVNLYVGRECVLRHVAEEEADTQLVNLIKAHGRWVEPPAVLVEQGG